MYDDPTWEPEDDMYDASRCCPLIDEATGRPLVVQLSDLSAAARQAPSHPGHAFSGDDDESSDEEYGRETFQGRAAIEFNGEVDDSEAKFAPEKGTVWINVNNISSEWAERRKPIKACNQLWGNGATFSFYMYKDTVVTLDLGQE